MIRIPKNDDEFYDFVILPNIKYCSYDFRSGYQIVYTNSESPYQRWFYENKEGAYGFESSTDENQNSEE